MHDANVEAPRRITRIARAIENLPGLHDILGNAFAKEITLPELPAAARKSGRAALLEKGCRILEITTDSLATVIQRPEHETARSVSAGAWIPQDSISVGLHQI